MSPVHSAYSQLFSVGILWVSIHCAGMCGPLLMGFDVAGVSCGVRPKNGAVSILTYQAGRALTYAWLGGIFGLFGAGLQKYLSLTGGYLTVAFGILMLFYFVFGSLRRYVPAMGKVTGKLSKLLTRTLRPILGSSLRRSPLRIFALGAAMGLLPCMITMWALTLAAMTASPFHGAVIMLLLVVMTTPMLLGVTLLPRLIQGKLGAKARHLPSILLGVSGIWLLLSGSAGLGWIHHAHFGFNAFGRDFAVMFW